MHRVISDPRGEGKPPEQGGGKMPGSYGSELALEQLMGRWVGVGGGDPNADGCVYTMHFLVSNSD